MNHIQPWGFSTHIDLSNCNPNKVKSRDAIKEYIIGLCNLINVKPWGEMQLEHFGEDERIAGFSVVQLIETSCVSGHFVDKTSSAYIDIFSCRYYDVEKAVAFTQSYFESSDSNYHFLERK